MFDRIVTMLTNIRNLPELKRILISLGVLDFKSYKFASQARAL